MSASYPRTENDTPDNWNEAESKVAANDNQLQAIEQVVNVGGYHIGPYRQVVDATKGMNTSAHHIVQDVAVARLESYDRDKAVAISLSDRYLTRGSEHYKATRVQAEATIGNSLGAEYQVANMALEAIQTLPKEAINLAMNSAVTRFTMWGYNTDTKTDVPATRKNVK